VTAVPSEAPSVYRGFLSASRNCGIGHPLKAGSEPPFKYLLKYYLKKAREAALNLLPQPADLKIPSPAVTRFFKTLRLWERLTLFARRVEWIQRRLDAYREWYSTVRQMWGLEGRTPQETWEGKPAPDPIPFRVHDPQPAIRVRRNAFHGDRRLVVIEIDVGFRLRPAG
jgi:hypothetical protein